MKNAELGQVLKNFRKRNGLSQQGVAEALGNSISKSSLSRLEHGRGKLDTDHELVILKYLNLPYSCGTMQSGGTGDTLRDIKLVLDTDQTISKEARAGLLDLLSHAYKILTTA